MTQKQINDPSDHKVTFEGSSDKKLFYVRGCRSRPPFFPHSCLPMKGGYFQTEETLSGPYIYILYSSWNPQICFSWLVRELLPVREAWRVDDWDFSPPGTTTAAAGYRRGEKGLGVKLLTWKLPPSWKSKWHWKNTGYRSNVFSNSKVQSVKRMNCYWPSIACQMVNVLFLH